MTIHDVNVRIQRNCMDILTCLQSLNPEEIRPWSHRIMENACFIWKRFDEEASDGVEDDICHITMGFLSTLLSSSSMNFSHDNTTLFTTVECLSCILWNLRSEIESKVRTGAELLSWILQKEYENTPMVGQFPAAMALLSETFHVLDVLVGCLFTNHPSTSTTSKEIVCHCCWMIAHLLSISSTAGGNNNSNSTSSNNANGPALDESSTSMTVGMDPGGNAPTLFRRSTPIGCDRSIDGSIHSGSGSGGGGPMRRSSSRRRLELPTTMDNASGPFSLHRSSSRQTLELQSVGGGSSDGGRSLSSRRINNSNNNANNNNNNGDVMSIASGGGGANVDGSSSRSRRNISGNLDASGSSSSNNISSRRMAADFASNGGLLAILDILLLQQSQSNDTASPSSSLDISLQIHASRALVAILESCSSSLFVNDKKTKKNLADVAIKALHHRGGTQEEVEIHKSGLAMVHTLCCKQAFFHQVFADKGAIPLILDIMDKVRTDIWN